MWLAIICIGKLTSRSGRVEKGQMGQMVSDIFIYIMRVPSSSSYRVVSYRILRCSR